MTRSVLLWPILIGLITGCGPVYKTTYTYKQPKQRVGRQCVRQCLRQKNRCTQTCIHQYNQCKQQENMLRLLKSEWHHPHHTSRPHLDIANDCTRQCGCPDNYNTCYASCGGTVTPHPKCVAFCHTSHG